MRSLQNSKPQIKNENLTVLEGELERITYFNEQTHYMIARLKTLSGGNLVTLVGFLAGIRPGEFLKVSGIWETHPRFGQQLRVKNYEVKLPATVRGIKKYLQSGMIKGLGKSLAQRMVDHFGVDTLQIIEKSSERLLEVEGIGEAKALLIVNAWNEHHVLRSLMQFLQDRGVKPEYGAKIYHLYGADAMEILRQTPYRLVKDLPGTGFGIADMISRKDGIADDDPVRARASIIHALDLFGNDGHTFAFKEQLISRCELSFKVPRPVLEKSIGNLSENEEIIVETMSEIAEFCENDADVDKSAVFLKPLFEAENGITRRLTAMLSVPAPEAKPDFDYRDERTLEQMLIELSPVQKSVLEDVMKHRVAIITGGPGTGKTTLIKAITAVLKARGKTVILGAPTGRASRRLSEVTGEKAATIHRLLGFTCTDGVFDKFVCGRNRDNPLLADVIIIDEASMIDTRLMYFLCEAVPLSARLVLVGDIFQLPSVGPGNVLRDMIRSELIPAFFLEKIFRQAQKSEIVLNAHRILNGETPVFTSFEDSDDTAEFFFIEQNDPEKIPRTIENLCNKIIPERFSFHPVYDIQVMTPMHKGIGGTINLNQTLQNSLNPTGEKIEVLGNTFKTGDKVIHLKNNYNKEVFNGDIGIISDINRGEKKFSVEFEGRRVDYEFLEADELALAYAISVHKSQGSEYPAVVIPLMTQHYPLLQRNLLYTAITRAKKLVILTGDPRAIRIAVNRDEPWKRLSGLAFRLGGQL